MFIQMFKVQFTKNVKNVLCKKMFLQRILSVGFLQPGLKGLMVLWRWFFSWYSSRAKQIKPLKLCLPLIVNHFQKQLQQCWTATFRIVRMYSWLPKTIFFLTSSYLDTSGCLLPSHHEGIGLSWKMLASPFKSTNQSLWSTCLLFIMGTELSCLFKLNCLIYYN